ncbi:MAG: hypothetical protein L6277_10460 [Desulfobacterales bacterium]|nr:hypothetical protein [Pseudomonadota bacterium]MCG2772495.1 hypothetical protein [Desulfobacterales bacterium]
MNRKSNLPKEYLEKGGPGRPKGVPNKVTRCMKAQTWKVFEALEANPKTSLEEIAKKNPMWFYTVFSSKIIPKDLNLRVIQSIDDLTEEEQQALLEDLGRRLGE